ncbi:ribonuclease H, partial [Trifolium medium]|nr:ribonuclease H [Trifolium medium]
MFTTLWKMAHGKLLTDMERCLRGMSSNDLCPCRDLAPESLMHTIRDCDVVKPFWN